MEMWKRTPATGGSAGLAVAAAVVLSAGTATADVQAGAWTPPTRWPISATHASLLATGQVLVFGEFENGDMPHLFDPDTETLTAIGQAGYNIFCAGHSFLEDGTLLIAGGHVDSHVGDQRGILYNPFTNQWTRTPDMRAGRWYPTNTTLPNGEIVVVSGEMESSGDNNPIPEVWQPSTGTYRQLTGANFELDYYPRQFLAPNGKVLVVTPAAQSYWLDTNGTGSIEPAPMQLQVDRRFYGGAVLYERGKILVNGGGDPPTAVSEVIDLDSATPAWRATSPMSVARRQHNTTLLPDGTVLVTGGSSGGGFNNRGEEVLPAEMWDPKTETWTTWASNSVYRGYHSTALLLPDGRVLVGGGRGSGDYTGQFFSPPYLFKGTRPTITTVSESAGWGGAFDVGTPDPSAIARVTLLAPGATTHSFDQNARFLELPFTPTPTGVRVTAPADANLAPPGFYLVFLIDANGVPSVGKFIHIGGDAGPPVDSVTLVAPNGGELLSPGTTLDISWGLTGAVTAVDLDFSPDGGTTWASIAARVPANPPHYGWVVPGQITNDGMVRVRLAGSDTIVDQSDAMFAIGVLWEGIPFGSVWRYHDDGTDPGATWFDAGYDDSAWKEGAGELGYGDGDEVTDLQPTTPSQTSVYFRRVLSLSGRPTATTMQIKFDDGFAVWVNGTLVSQRNVDRGLEHDVYASATAENVLVKENLPVEAFVPGDNVMAVMIKQLGPTSNDLGFDLELQVVGGEDPGTGGSGGTGGAGGAGGTAGGGGTDMAESTASSDQGCACTGAENGIAWPGVGIALLGIWLRRRRR